MMETQLHVMCVGDVVATNMVELKQLTDCGCVLHGVKHATHVASRTTSQKSANQKGNNKQGTRWCFKDEEATIDVLIVHVVFDPVIDIIGQAELVVKIAKRIVNGNVGPLSFTEQCDPGHPAVLKYPYPRY